MNNTSNIPEDVNPYKENSSVHVVVVSFGMFVVVWAIFANSIVVICFFVNRKKIWPSFSTQILSVCVSDMFVGYASLPVFTISSLNNNLSPRTYLVIYPMFIATQCASLYNVFGLCIYRCIVIQNSAQPNQNRFTFRASLLFTISSWIVSIVVCVLPTIFIENPDLKTSRCTVNEMFKSNAPSLWTFYFIIYTVPYILTNVLYVFACFRLKAQYIKVLPISQSTTGPVTDTGNSSIGQVSHMRMQTKVLVTVGIILLIFNLCTIPIIALIQLKNNENQVVKRNAIFIVFTMLILNSALNPFIYALRTDWLKKALRQMCKDCVLKLCH